MILIEKICKIYNFLDDKYLDQFGFRMGETSFQKIVEYLHTPKDSSSLAVTRILFGLAMLFDIPDERGGAIMARRWGGRICHFPLLPIVTAVPMPYMALVYAALWLGALGIMLGCKYRLSSATFALSYWYLLLIEKSFWNNHSYLFGLVALLLSFTQANCYWSVDAYLNPSKKRETVPYWNYFILKYQFFILYFMAGMKKGTAEWLTGYSVQNLSEHWVFDPFKLFLTVPQIDYIIVHCFIFLFDLTVAFWMMWSRTRHLAMFFCAMFHLMNSRLFRIGMFPWVCLATMPLYYPFDWPKTVLRNLSETYAIIKRSICSYFTPSHICHTCSCPIPEAEDYNNPNKDTDLVGNYFVEQNKLERDISEKDDVFVDSVTVATTKTEAEVTNSSNKDDVETVEQFDKAELEQNNKLEEEKNENRKKIITTCMIFIYIITQAFLPYSHFITKGYNNWTDGLYGYSWDMMVHTWDTQSVIIKIVDRGSTQEFYIDPSTYTPNDRWSRHGDMVYQYAHCLKHILLKEREKLKKSGFSGNFSIYVDVWCSMNGRFTQRLFDSKVDILEESWSPFEKIPFLMPLLDEALHWRSHLKEIIEEVHSWGNASDVVFYADFPGYEQEKYIPPELHNVTLSVLEGDVAYEEEAASIFPNHCYKIANGSTTAVNSGIFHKVYNVGLKPAYYMYTFTNSSEDYVEINEKVKPKLPIINELSARLKGMLIFFITVINSIYQLVFTCNGDCL